MESWNLSFWDSEGMAWHKTWAPQRTLSEAVPSMAKQRAVSLTSEMPWWLVTSCFTLPARKRIPQNEGTCAPQSCSIFPRCLAFYNVGVCLGYTAGADDVFLAMAPSWQNCWHRSCVEASKQPTIDPHDRLSQERLACTQTCTIRHLSTFEYVRCAKIFGFYRNYSGTTSI